MNDVSIVYQLDLSFERTQLPPFSDILLLGRRCPIGMGGLGKSLEFLVPNHFDLVPLEEDPTVEAMVINRAITKRMPVDLVKRILQERVIPHMFDTEMVRVDFKIKMTQQGIIVEI